MRKLKLDIQELEVESFTVLSSPVGGGTVEGRVKVAPDPLPMSAFWTECNWYCGVLSGNTCVSCGTCENQGSCGAEPTCLRYGGCGPT